MKYSIVVVFCLFAASKPVFCQVTYNGIIKVTAKQSILPINGVWNSADHTGNVAIDKAMDKAAAASKNNTKAIRALEATSAKIKTDPQKFLNPDGSVNKKALSDLISQQFAGVGEVTVPSLEIAADSTNGMH